MTSCRSCRHPAAVFANEVRVTFTFRNIALLTRFLRQRFFSCFHSFLHIINYYPSSRIIATSLFRCQSKIEFNKVYLPEDKQLTRSRGPFRCRTNGCDITRRVCVQRPWQSKWKEEIRPNAVFVYKRLRIKFYFISCRIGCDCARCVPQTTR